MDAVEFVGKTTEDALKQAQEHFELPLDQLEVEVLSAGSGGLFGLMGKKAVVKARPRGKTDAEEVAEMVAMVTESGQPPAENAPQREDRPKPPPPKEPEPPARAEAPEAPPAEPKAEAEPEPEPAEPRGEAAAEPAEPAKARLEDDPEVLAFAQEVLTKLVGALDGGARIKAASGKNGVELDIDGQEVGVLIGRRGQTLDALQYLTTRSVSHNWGRAVRVAVDAGGYRQRRRQSLEETALRLAHKAREGRKPVSIGPLNSQERRVVHLVLRGERGISTASRGRGELKKVFISPR